MHFHIAEQQIIAPAFSIAAYLKQHLKPDEQVYVIGSKAIAQELDNLKIKNFGIGEDLVEGKWLNMLQTIESECRKLTVGAVVVGFDDHFSFVKMLKASRFLMPRSCHFLSTNSDAVHRYPKYSIPGTGAILKALETCVARDAQVMGKPNPLICKHLIRTGVIKPARTLMIGDSPQVDVLFGKNCGFHTLLVGTGCYQWPHVEKLVESNTTDHIPNYYADSLGDLYKIFE
ncbi:hypothetical protein DOY81_013505 [Sarcophaga bullata]|nr:hypothetical protein DOY81_013505 [Sarcophaga bullata]